MKYTFQYTDLMITIEAKTLDATIDAIELSGKILEKIQQLRPQWGKPKFTQQIGVFCLKCHHEIPVIHLKKGKCPKCGEKPL